LKYKVNRGVIVDNNNSTDPQIKKLVKVSTGLIFAAQKRVKDAKET